VDVDQCSADEGITVSVTSDDGQNTQTQQIEIETLAVYNFILSLGLVYDFSLETEFITRTPKGATVPQIVADEHVRGLQNPILVLGYHFYPVDAERPRQGTDFIPSPFLGFSFTDPLEHLYFGIVFEPFPGLGALIGYHAFEEETLAGGYEVGDSFPSGDVPTNERWTLDARNIVLGLNVDSAIFANILKALKGK
jgi:hypothetical protein